MERGSFQKVQFWLNIQPLPVEFSGTFPAGVTVTGEACHHENDGDYYVP